MSIDKTNVDRAQNQSDVTLNALIDSNQSIGISEYERAQSDHKLVNEAGFKLDRSNVVFQMTAAANNGAPDTDDGLFNRSSVLFVAVSLILLMVISLAWLVFYYVQRFRYLHRKERASRHWAELAKKAVSRIPIKTLRTGDKETNPELDRCAICIEPYRPLDNLRILPCHHYFHKLCIDPWLLDQHSCPMCKLDIIHAYGLRANFFLGCSASDPLAQANPASEAVRNPSLASERVALVHAASNSATQTPLAVSSRSLSFGALGTEPASVLSAAHTIPRRPRPHSQQSWGVRRNHIPLHSILPGRLRADGGSPEEHVVVAVVEPSPDSH